MNCKTIKPKRIRTLINPAVLLALVSGLFFGGCIRDEGSMEAEDGAKVLITVNLPEESLPTRADINNEGYIGNLRILVLERDNGDYNLLYAVDADEISGSGSNQRFQAQLLATDKPLKLIVVANAAGQSNPSAGTPEADVRSAYTFSSDDLAGYLPMYGEYLLDNGLETGNNAITIPALRAVARVDVVKDLETGSPDFILEEVYAFRANDTGRVIPDPVTDISAPVVDAPSIPTGAAFLNDPLFISVTGGADAIEGLYVPESRAAATIDDRFTGVTTIVIGGRYNGSDQVTYYRADFDPDGTGQDFGQVLRNHRYTFNIKRVSAPGWDTPDEAANNFNAPIIIDIQAWQDFAADISYGISNFKISARSLNLRYVANRTKVLDVESSRDYTIQWLDTSGDPIGQPISSSTESSISNDDFEVSVSLEPADADQTQLVFRTLKNNYDGTSMITRKLRITVGLSTIDITVNQDYTGLYSGRSFNVMTGYDSANPFAYLGTTATQNPTISTFSYYPAWAMRAILDARFAPTGTVRIGGFSFDMLSDVTDYFGATTNTTTIERIIRQQDVIFLTYHTAPSTQVTTLLLNWLDQDPHRVLIIAADNTATNANIRSFYGVSWTFNTSATTGAYRTAAVADADFFAGPFGAINTDATINRYDDAFGYSTSYPNVTPLIVRQSNNSAMIVGVDKASRIIYIGDVNLFQHTVSATDTTGPMSNDNGNVTTDLERLMANMWAWVVEQLIYGND